MIVRPYIKPGNMVVYSPPGRDDVRITVTVVSFDPLIGVFIEYAGGVRALVDESRLFPMPEVRMQPVVSIRQVVDECAANGMDVSSYERLAKKHGVGG